MNADDGEYRVQEALFHENFSYPDEAADQLSRPRSQLRHQQRQQRLGYVTARIQAAQALARSRAAVDTWRRLSGSQAKEHLSEIIRGRLL